MDDADATPTQPRDAGEETPDPVPLPAPRRKRLLAFGFIASALLRALGASWRIRVVGRDPREHDSQQGVDGPHLAALFHESMLASAYFFRDSAYSVAISRSRDGDLIATVLARLGYAEPARGSSSRGGPAALLTLSRQLDEGTTVSVLVDGPRGPVREVKPGIIALSRLSGCAIQPVAFAARPALRMGSWDRSLLPLPFARVVVAFGEPLRVGSEADDESEDEAARRLGLRMRALHERAEQSARGQTGD